MSSLLRLLPTTLPWLLSKARPFSTKESATGRAELFFDSCQLLLLGSFSLGSSRPRDLVDPGGYLVHDTRHFLASAWVDGNPLQDKPNWPVYYISAMEPRVAEFQAELKLALGRRVDCSRTSRTGTLRRRASRVGLFGGLHFTLREGRCRTTCCRFVTKNMMLPCYRWSERKKKPQSCSSQRSSSSGPSLLSKGC